MQRNLYGYYKCNGFFNDSQNSRTVGLQNLHFLWSPWVAQPDFLQRCCTVPAEPLQVKKKEIRWYTFFLGQGQVRQSCVTIINFKYLATCD